MGETPAHTHRNSYTENFDDLLKAEKAHIDQEPSSEQPSKVDSNYRGLAFSGGGIRSASFGMGLMQSLAGSDKLKLMDYLSTVSGGGYLGSSLTWYLSQRDKDGKPLFNCSDRFPFGTKNAGNKTDRNSLVNNILNYIRQHGNYLIPGKDLDVLSFVATILRVIVGSFLIYLLLTTLIMVLLINFISWFWTTSALTAGFFGFFLTLGAAGIAVFVVISLFFSVRTFFGFNAYDTDILVQKILGLLLKFVLVCVVMALLPVVADNITPLISIVFTGASDDDVIINGSLAVSSSLIGAILGFLSHRKSMESDKPISGLQINLAAGFLLFGMLFGAYWIATELFPILSPAYFILLTIGILIGALICNVNVFGLNRMYRNRLMETFMQAAAQVKNGIWRAAADANRTLVADMCKTPNNRPYHLINCNVILVDSNRADYRGRKGDSFVFSPLYTGSDATGWKKTRDYSKRGFRQGMMLPTAMAISGAAANPNAGVAGQGPTTERTVALVMSILNLRLGFWAENPKRAPWLIPPNYLVPGLQGASLFRDGLSEDRHYLELSDGGHFENLAIYELLRRRLPLILVSDAGQDGNFEFSDLANAVEKARVDFGINIEFDENYSLQDLVPGSENSRDHSTAKDYLLAKRGFALATIYYPAVHAEQTENNSADRSLKVAAMTGYLVYVKPTLIKSLTVDVIGYRRQHQTFPHESTLDQFFDEVQFEAYRELGYSIGKEMLDAMKTVGPETSCLLSKVSNLLK